MLFTENGLKYELVNLGIGDSATKKINLRENLESGKYSGVLVVDLNSDIPKTTASLVNILAHTLQDSKRSEFERKVSNNEIVFPPVASVNEKISLAQNPQALATILAENPPNEVQEIILSMQLGEYGIPKQEVLSIQEMLTPLISKMKIPARPKKILVVDDNPDFVENIIKILKAWPNIQVTYINPRLDDTNINAGLNQAVAEADIILLDEDLGIQNFTGTDLFNQSESLGEEVLKFISITSGNTPTWAKCHFEAKTELNNLDTAKIFVETINQSL